jgi:putative membrane protein
MNYRKILASGVTAAVMAALPLLAASTDSSFVMKAAEGGHAEVQMGQLAQTKANSQAVKDLANRLVVDHTKANDNLKPIASKDNVTWPTGMNAKQQAEYNKLQALSGADFDREYVNYEIKEHKQDINAFQHEANRGNDPEVKAWASENVPTLQEHLRLAETALSSVK